MWYSSNPKENGMPGTETTYSTFLIQKEGPVDWLTLNRPEALNAATALMCDELRAYFERLRRDHEVRVVVMRGAGRAFCAGLDLKESRTMDAGQGVEFMMRRQRSTAEVIIAMRRAPQPVIGLIHGAAVGSGFAFALGCDVRYAGKSARMSVAVTKMGLSGCDMGISYHLTRAVGMSTASEIMLTGRFVDAARALRSGLVSEVMEDGELESAGRALAEDMASLTPFGLRLTKEAINYAVDAGSLEAQIAMEDRQQILCTATGDFNESVAAFIEKRKPVYGKKPA
jgi:enoyl-CoA hydratase/carnithine racemase